MTLRTPRRALAIGGLLVLLVTMTACTVTRERTGQAELDGTSTVTAGATPTPISTPDEPTPAPSPTPEPTATQQPTPTEPSPTPTATATPTPTPSPTPAPTPTPTPTPEPTPTPKPSLTPPPTPDPTPEQPAGAYPIECGSQKPTFDSDLQAVITETIGGQSSGFSVVVHNLLTGAGAEIDPAQSYYGASLYKVAVMYEAVRQIEQGRLSLDQVVTIQNRHAEQDLGTLEALGWGPGTRVTIEQALTAAITVSDNATAYLLAELVGWGRMDQTLHEIGAADTHFSWLELPTTAADQATIMRAIACGSGVSEEHRRFMLDLLARQSVNNRLPLYLPGEAVVAHKTGNWKNANHDVGIVYGPDAAYVIAVMTSLPGADETIARLSRNVYDYVQRSDNTASDD